MNENLWPVHAFVDGLVENGVRHAVISPGSRNTPLTLALAEQPEIQVYTHMDERAAAFFALGLAKVTGAPVALACTSGTATANYYPAVMEAFEARVPLLVLTADRPPELRDIGANQAVRQMGMYAAHVKWAFEMPIPDGRPATARHAAAIAARAAALAVTPPYGPIHINYPFAEPLMLPPRAELAKQQQVVAPRVFTATVTEPPAAALDALASALRLARRPLLVIGPQTDARLAAVIEQFAQATRIPLLADPLSQARFGENADGSSRIRHYDLLLQVVGDDIAPPDLVLRFGAQPTAKSLARFLQRAATAGARVFMFDETSLYRDPDVVATDVITGNIGAFLQREAAAFGVLGENYLTAWLALDARVAAVIDDYAREHWFEGTALRAMVSALPAGAQLMIGNSRPIRDIDALAGSGRGRLEVYGNRGVSGIDGIVSTAFGLAAARSDVPTVLCIGDVSFYHDLNGLLAATRFHVGLTVVLVHNAGGGIFQHLSQATRQETLDYFTTPHNLEFAEIVQAYGGVYRQAQGASELLAALQLAVGRNELNVIEVRFGNDESVLHYKELRALLQRALKGALS